MEKMQVENCQLDASSQEVKCLKEELENLREIIKSMRAEKIKLEKENHYLQKQLEILSLDHSTHLFENDQNRNERKRLNSFQQIFEVNDQSQPTLTHPPVVSHFHGNDNVLAMAPPQDERISTHLEQFENPQSSATTSDSCSYSVQVDDRTPLLTTAQDTSNTKSAVGIVYKMYELLILALSHSLLQRDIKKIKEWASTNFSIQNNLGAKEIFLKLEEKRIINFADLSQLCNFLRTILRFDLVNVIENYETGNYTHLKKLITEYKARQKKSLDSARWSGERGTRPRLAMTNGNRTYQDFQNMAVHTPSEQTSLQRSFPQVLGTSANNFKRNAFNPILQPSIFDHSRGNERGNNSTDINVRNRNESSESSEPVHNVNTSSRCVISSSGLINTEGQMQNALQVRSAAESNVASSSNQRSAHSTLTQQARNVRWLCTHYKRRCYVKFQCCDKYWPCHRCHNNQSNCGQKKLKSRDVKMVKCAECGKEQQFGESCVSCNIPFADYYCGICKHLTGLDDKPYHCDKCGICRVHGDRSYHCDVCGICLDVQLRGNHECRPNSAHDACCICLEDAFTGCQILPCSHKVHKECAAQMLQRGITRCPICRKSFAHKLKRKNDNKR